jgi:hypothetical protein
MNGYISKNALGAFIFLVCTCLGCSKDSEAPRASSTVSLYGIWTGTYNTNQITHPAQQISFTFYPDGNVAAKVKGNPPAPDAIYEAGTWTMTGKTITYNVTTLNYTTVIKQEGSFTFNDTALVNGTWKNNTSDNGVFYTGTFSTMTKVN